MRAAEYSTGALKQYQDNLGSNGALEHFRKDMHRLFNAGFVAWRADDKSCTTQAFWDSKHPRAGYDFNLWFCRPDAVLAGTPTGWNDDLMAQNIAEFFDFCGSGSTQ